MSNRGGRIPEETIQTIRERTDVVDLVGRYVSLKKAGRSFKGLCPFHHEKTPSFIVTRERGTYHCFGCGEGGNAFSFLMHQEGLSFPEAVRSLGAELGVEIPEHGSDGADRGVLEQVFAANELAQTFFRRALLSAQEGSVARSYMVERGLHREDAERFGIGYAPDGWTALADALAADGVRAEIAEKAGLLKPRDSGGHYDVLRGRLTFPIHDARKRVVAFGGRALSDGQEPKYLNTPESPVFRKRECFYGMPDALAPIRQNDRAVVVEGYFDQIAMVRAGVGEALATCGTALSEEHARGLRRRTQNVVLLFDGDEAGQRAVLRSLELLLPAGLRVRAASLPGGSDPDDFLRDEGPEALARIIDEAPPAIELAIQRAVAAGCATPWERADAVAAVVPLLLQMDDPVERGEFARRLAFAVGTEPADVEAALRKSRRGEEPEAESGPASPRPVTAEDRHFETVLRVLLDHRAALDPVDGEAIHAVAPDAEWRSLATALLEGSGADVVADLLDTVDPVSRQRLSVLANAERPDLATPEHAPRILADELEWLGRRAERLAAQDLTRRIRSAEGGPDPDLILQKQRQLEQRQQKQNRLARGVPNG